MVTILAVDDAEFFRKMYADALSKAGFNVETAENGREAVEKIRSLQPKLVLMDLVMPEMTGAEALDAIKADDTIKSTPVLMLTSIAAEIKGEDLLLRGAVGYLVKDDITPEAVVAKVSEILGTSQAPLDPTKA
ncbi:MAG TPA: response regulator [Candidatus Saccharimonadales bacterium]|nr:response regulator [Candidatus Saccharimonadales bacterium]